MLQLFINIQQSIYHGVYILTSVWVVLRSVHTYPWCTSPMSVMNNIISLNLIDCLHVFCSGIFFHGVCSVSIHFVHCHQHYWHGYILWPGNINNLKSKMNKQEYYLYMFKNSCFYCVLWVCWESACCQLLKILVRINDIIVEVGWVKDICGWGCMETP